MPIDYAEAMRWYRRAADGGEALALYNLGNLYADGLGVPKDEAEAERLYQEGVDRGIWQAKNALAYSWALEGKNLDAALKLADEALAEQPDDGDILDTRGWILFRQGRLDEAAAELQRALEHLPYETALTHGHLGDVYAALGQAEKAHAEWEAGLNADPPPDLAARSRRSSGRTDPPDRALRAQPSDAGT